MLCSSRHFPRHAPHWAIAQQTLPSHLLSPFTLQAVRSARRRGTAIVLTTHSMLEAEALGDRLGIFVAGQLRALGSAQVRPGLTLNPNPNFNPGNPGSG